MRIRIISCNCILVAFNVSCFSAGYRSLGELGLKSIQVDLCGDGEAAAEGAHLAAFKYQDLKSKKKESPLMSCFEETDQGFVTFSMYL